LHSDLLLDTILRIFSVQDFLLFCENNYPAFAAMLVDQQQHQSDPESSSTNQSDLAHMDAEGIDWEKINFA
jgi:hypothetical protein